MIKRHRNTSNRTVCLNCFICHVQINKLIEIFEMFIIFFLPYFIIYCILLKQSTVLVRCTDFIIRLLIIYIIIDYPARGLSAMHTKIQRNLTFQCLLLVRFKTKSHQKEKSKSLVSFSLQILRRILKHSNINAF